MFSSGLVVLKLELVITFILCRAVSDRNLPPKSLAPPARDVPHRLGKEGDEPGGARAFLFPEERRADGLVQQVAFREVGPIEMAPFHASSRARSRADSPSTAASHLFIAQGAPHRAAPDPSWRGRSRRPWLHTSYAGQEFFRTKIIESETPVWRAYTIEATGLRNATGAGYSKNGVGTMNYIAERAQLRQSQLVGLIEEACQHLEPSSYQRDLAKQRYEGVGDWLARSDDRLLASIAIRLQGSVAIGTTVKPVGANEHDVDLVAHVPDLDIAVSPALLKQRIGDRLRSNGNYAPLLVEMPRCWRLDYANEFHLDITPSIPNPECRFGGELVPDKTLKIWKASNPKGYRAKFERRAALQPRIRSASARPSTAPAPTRRWSPIPRRSALKGILRRIVQIAKRHRDLHFIDDGDGLAPLSIIITTLASRAYEFCVSNFEYDHELDLIVDVLAPDAGRCCRPARRRTARLVSLESDHRRRELLREVEQVPRARGRVLRMARQGRRRRRAPRRARRGSTRCGGCSATSSARRRRTRRWIR